MPVGKSIKDARRLAAKRYYKKHKKAIIAKHMAYNKKWRKGLVGKKHRHKKR